MLDVREMRALWWLRGKFGIYQMKRKIKWMKSYITAIVARMHGMIYAIYVLQKDLY